jgi:DNA-binding GntR family transcriptional regulator
MTDQVYAMLHEAILNGDLAAGTPLRFKDLAEQVGTSTMPVREALRRLEAAGLAERAPHKGVIVKEISLKDLVPVYDVRHMLEPQAARLGSQNISAEDCDRMEAEYLLLREAFNEGRVVALLDHDEAILSILYSASGNPVLLQMIRTLWQQCRAYKIVGARGRLADGDDSLWHYQEELLAAARRNDADAAASISDTSLTDASNRIRAALEAQREAH